MSILVDKNTRLVVQGITGNEGLFHTQGMLAYGTNVVAGTRPGKGGEWVLDGKVPVFDSVKIAVEATEANTSVIFVEWLQNKRAEQWELADVLGRLEKRMKQTYANVRQYAQAQKTDWRTASYAIGLERLQHCYKERGIFP